RALNRGEEIDRSEREQERQSHVLDFAPEGAARTPELLENQKEDCWTDAREPDDELAVPEVLRAPREPEERHHQDGRKRRKADEPLRVVQREVVHSCVRGGTAEQMVTTMKPRVGEQGVVVVGG